MKAIFMLVVLALSYAPAFGQTGNLEVPGNGSFQSGIGFMSGWVCRGRNVEIVLNGIQRLTVARNIPRGDTEAACGDTNNGFITQWNWNLLGEGKHKAALVVDGRTVQENIFAVTTLGEEFVRGAAADVEVQGFPTTEEATTLRWQESTQGFVLIPEAGAAPPRDGLLKPEPSADPYKYDFEFWLTPFVSSASEVNSNGEWHGTGLTGNAWPITSTLTLWIDDEDLLESFNGSYFPRGVVFVTLQTSRAAPPRGWMTARVNSINIDGNRVTLHVRQELSYSSNRSSASESPEFTVGQSGKFDFSDRSRAGVPLPWQCFRPPCAEEPPIED